MYEKMFKNLLIEMVVIVFFIEEILIFYINVGNLEGNLNKIMIFLKQSITEGLPEKMNGNFKLKIKKGIEQTLST